MCRTSKRFSVYEVSGGGRDVRQLQCTSYTSQSPIHQESDSLDHTYSTHYLLSTQSAKLNPQELFAFFSVQEAAPASSSLDEQWTLEV